MTMGVVWLLVTRAVGTFFLVSYTHTYFQHTSHIHPYHTQINPKQQPGSFAPPNDFGKRTLLWVDLPAVARWAGGRAAEAGGGEGGACYVMELAPGAVGAGGGAVEEGGALLCVGGLLGEGRIVGRA